MNNEPDFMELDEPGFAAEAASPDERVVMRAELDIFADGVIEQDIAALFCVKLIRNDKETITGAPPELITEFTCMPWSGFPKEQQDKMRILLDGIAQELAAVLSE